MARRVTRPSSVLGLLLAGCAAAPPVVDRAASFDPYRQQTVNGVPLNRYGGLRTAFLCWGVDSYRRLANDHLHFQLEPTSGYGLATAVATDGYLVTAGHCVDHDGLILLFKAGGDLWAATPRVVVHNGPGEPDLAVVKVDHPLDAALPWAADVRPGTVVIGIGSGLDDHPPTRVAALAGRVIRVEPESRGSVVAQPLEGDLPGRPGDSGGAVFTPAGDGVGVIVGGDPATGRCRIVRPDPGWLAGVIAADRRHPPPADPRSAARRIGPPPPTPPTTARATSPPR